MYLVVDCETNGLPRDWKVPVSDVVNWPRAVQVAWALYDPQHEEILSVSYIVRPDDFDIPWDAERVHGISMERAEAEGIPVAEVLTELSSAAGQASVIVAHNASFDGSVLAAEYLRAGFSPPFSRESMVCTMVESTDYCCIPGGPTGTKWPTLDELHSILFGTCFAGAHDAGADVAACACCFFELKNRGVIRVS